MGRHKMKSGVCRICGETKKLSFEHVPPRVTFNKNTKYLDIPFEKYMSADDPLNNPPKGKIKQGGIGYNSLCKECNNFLGSKYVEPYKNYVLAGHEVLNQTKFNFHYYRINSQEPLYIIKHIISMFLAINGEWYLNSYPELSNFVKDPNSNYLPERYRVFSYLNSQGKSRYLGHSIIYNPALGGLVNCSEIAFPPYGYVLTIDFEKKINILTDITFFKNYNPDDRTALTLSMFDLPTHFPLPFDYRTRDKLEADIKNSLIARNRNK